MPHTSREICEVCRLSGFFIDPSDLVDPTRPYRHHLKLIARRAKPEQQNPFRPRRLFQSIVAGLDFSMSLGTNSRHRIKQIKNYFHITCNWYTTHARVRCGHSPDLVE